MRRGAADRVVVIGAGVSGLAAGAALQAAGFGVTVVEARTRIGGRIHTSSAWPDLPIDLGASWIHGVDGNPVTELATHAGVRLVPTSYDSSELHIDPALSAAGVADAGEDDAEALFERAIAAANNLDADVSIADALAAVAPPASLSVAQRAQLDFFVSANYEQEYSGSARTMSAWTIDDNEEFTGGDALLSGGYAQIAELLARGLDIRLGRRVTEVRWFDRNASVVLGDGTVLEASDVIVTVPLGVLKTNAITFDPPLPEPVRRAVDRLGMGLLNKHWLRFDTVRWPRDIDWHEYLGPSTRWSEWVSLATIGAPVLLVFSAADAADEIERLEDRAIVAEAMAVARTMFGADLPDPVATQITRWRSDPLALGSYSFNAVGSSNADRRALARGTGLSLHFAGEAASQRYPGTVHGALLSGRQAAARLITERQRR